MVSAHLEWEIKFEKRRPEDEGEELYSGFWILYFSLKAFSRVDR
jgi:hypothetical protein